MKNNSTVAVDEAILAKPKYYEMDGALKANANRAWLLAFLTIPIALLAIGFAVFVRLAAHGHPHRAQRRRSRVRQA